jgi:hypothetical protein
MHYLDCNKDEWDPDFHEEEGTPGSMRNRRANAILSKRSRTVGEFKVMAYPENTKLYTGKRKNDVPHILTFQNKKLGSSTVKDFQTFQAQDTINNYVTEHILEVSKAHKSKELVLTLTAPNHDHVQKVYD